MPHPYRVKQMKDRLFGGAGDYKYDSRTSCAVIVRGEVLRHFGIPGSRSSLSAARLANGQEIDLLNLHLQPAVTDLRLWRRECWRTHSLNRKLRRHELETALHGLVSCMNYPHTPAVIAGDFNAAANDRLYRMLEGHFTDAFRAAGTGWGNTYHRRLPLLRIDHVYGSSRHFVPVRCRAVKVPQSDHRMVIADLVLQ